MKKILSWIFSAALAMTVAVPAQAQAPAQKAGAHAHSLSATALAKPAETTSTQRFVTPAVRSNSTRTTNALRTVHTGTVAPQRAVVVNANTNLPTINGLIMFAESWGQNLQVGLYTLPSATGGQFTPIWTNTETSTVYSAIALDGVYYTHEYTNFMGFIQFFQVFGYDLDSGEKVYTYEGDGPSCIALGVAKDPTTGNVYGVFYNDDASGYRLCTIEYTEPAPTINTVAALDLSNNFNTLVCDKNGQLYAFTYDAHKEGDNTVVDAAYLVKIDKNTAAVTSVGITGQLPVYMSGATVDQTTNRCFWAVSNDSETSGYLCEVDLATGAATPVVIFSDGEEVNGLYVPAPATPGTPDVITNLNASFIDGSLSGNVTFNAPAKNIDGTTAASLTYSVKANGNEVATGSTTYGAAVTAPVTVATAGDYTISVTVKNGTLESKAVKVKCFIGKGTPKAPVATLAYENGTMKLSWEPVTESSDGGYINPAEVTYTVVRFPGEQTVATGIKTTTFSEAIAEPAQITSYYYTVSATYGTATSEGTSNTVTLGSIVPPYSNDFADESSLSGFTIIDANNDGKTWKWHSGAVRASYNSSKTMDDWLITPPMKLEAGKSYPVSFDTYCNGSSFPERIEVKWGNGTTVAAMTNTLMEATVVNTKSDAPIHFEGFISPTTSGTYSIGFHGISDEDMYYLYVDNIAVGEGVSASAPGMVENLTATPDPTGAYSATIAMKAPSKTLAGNALSAIDKVELLRGETVIKTFNAPAPGAALNFTDNVGQAGTVTYTAVAYNSSGKGQSSSTTIFVGTGIPAAPATVNAVETTTDGQVTISWTQVTTDENGNAINPAKVTYDVYIYDGQSRTPIQTGLSTTELTATVLQAGEQSLMQFAVWPVTEAGEGEGNVSPMIPVGTPYEGYFETFANGSISYDLGITRINGSPAWQILKDDSFSDLTSYDADNGFIGMKGETLDCEGAIFTGKISLAGMVNPGVTVAIYNIVGDNGGSADIVAIEAREVGTTDYTVLLSGTRNELCNNNEGWSTISAPLTGFEGKVVQVRLRAVTKQYIWHAFDAIKVASMVGNDLKAHSVSAPAKVNAGEAYTASVKVVNEGFNAATAFNVELYADGKLVESKPVETLAAGKSTEVEFNMTMHALAEEPVNLHAVVVYGADENTENNTTEAITVSPKVSTLPAVTDLKGEIKAEGAVLSWSEPNLEGGVAETKTDDMESYEGFAHEAEGWTFVDVDGKNVGGFQNTDIPGLTPGESTASFFVFEASSTYPQFNQSFAAHSGTKYLASMFAYDDSQVDDWAISPALSGNAQTISFYAKSYSKDYPEKIEVLYSTGSLSPADFVSVKALSTVPADWTLYEAELPAGAAYFAIRSYSAGAFMLMIDDVTFESGSATANLSLIGYNVWRNGEKLTAEPTGETTFTDANAPSGNNKYVVTTVYDRGESRGSNTIELNNSGVISIETGVKVKAADGNIIVTGAEGQAIVVNSVDGRTLFAGTGAAETKVAVSTGIYLVKVGNGVTKLIVR